MNTETPHKHEINILNDLISKAEGLSARLVKWGKKVKAEIEAELARLESNEDDAIANPTPVQSDAVSVNEGLTVTEPVSLAEQTPPISTPDAPLTSVEGSVDPTTAPAPGTQFLESSPTPTPFPPETEQPTAPASTLTAGEPDTEPAADTGTIENPSPDAVV